MELLFIIFFIFLFLYFILAFFIPAILKLWFVWLILAIIVIVYRNIRGETYTDNTHNDDVIDVDYTIKDEESGNDQ